MALNLEIQTYQILTKDDEVCISSLSSILLAVLVDLYVSYKSHLHTWEYEWSIFLIACVQKSIMLG